MIFLLSKKRLLQITVTFMITAMVFVLHGKVRSSPVEIRPSQINGYVALVIDDFGSHREGVEEIINLGIPLTVAVMPFQPYSRSDAKAAHNAGLEVILHIPMEPKYGKPDWLGPKGITCNLSDKEIKSRIRTGLKELKWAAGMNNHMGSKATQDRRVMKAVLQVAKEEKLYFLDSKTTPKSVVAEVSQSLGVDHFERDVFLDLIKSQAEIEAQLKRLAEIALKRGYAVGIGHVGPEGGSVTARAIRSMKPILQAKGVRFVYLSELRKSTVKLRPIGTKPRTDIRP